MKYISSVVHAVRVLHQLKQADDASPWSSIPVAQQQRRLSVVAIRLASESRAMMRGGGNVVGGRGRVLEDVGVVDEFSSFFGGDNEEENGDEEDLLTSLLGNGELLAECGVDVEDLTAKAFGVIMMGGMGGGGGDADLADIFGFDPVAMLSALQDDDEAECTTFQDLEVMTASLSYLKCSGVDQFLDIEAVFAGNFDTFDFIDELVSSCEQMTDIVSEAMENLDDLDFDLDSEATSKLMEAAYSCGKAALGDNPIGNYIRYSYQNMDDIFGCMSEYAEAIPHCLLGIPEDDGAPAVMLPLSLEKKMYCVSGKIFPKLIEESCLDTYEQLNTCLPDVNESFIDENVRQDCQSRGAIVGNYEINNGVNIDSSVLTSNRIPGYCVAAFDKELYNTDTSGLMARYEYYNAHREYGWTIDEFVSEEEEEDDMVSEEEDEEEDEGEYEDGYGHEEEDEAEETAEEDDEAEGAVAEGYAEWDEVREEPLTESHEALRTESVGALAPPSEYDTMTAEEKVAWYEAEWGKAAEGETVNEEDFVVEYREFDSNDLANEDFAKVASTTEKIKTVKAEYRPFNINAPVKTPLTPEEKAAEKVAAEKKAKRAEASEEVASQKVFAVVASTKETLAVPAKYHEFTFDTPVDTQGVASTTVARARNVSESSINENKLHYTALAVSGLVGLTVVLAFVAVRMRGLSGRSFTMVSRVDDLEFAESAGEIA